MWTINTNPFTAAMNPSKNSKPPTRAAHEQELGKKHPIEGGIIRIRALGVEDERPNVDTAHEDVKGEHREGKAGTGGAEHYRSHHRHHRVDGGDEQRSPWKPQAFHHEVGGHPREEEE